MADSGSTSTDVVRKLTIMGVLFGGMILLHRFAIPDPLLDSRGLLALGFVVMAAYVVGELAHVIKLPHITGYLMMGLLLGPSVAEVIGGALPEGYRLLPPLDEGILNDRVKGQLLLMDSLALGLIALTAGGELKVEALKSGFRHISGMLTGQGIAVFTSVTAFVTMVGLGWLPGLTIPPLSVLPFEHILAVSLVVASVSLATSPPVTIAVMNGVGAKGIMTTTVLSGVILLDVVVVIAYSAMNAFAGSLMGLEGAGGLMPALTHIGAAVLLGIGLGMVIHLYLRHVGAEILLFIVGVIFAATFVANALHAEVALVFIVAGFVIGNFSALGDKVIHEMERMSLPVYVVFFTLAGAKLHLDVLVAMAPLAIGLALVRAGSVFVGVRAGATLTGADRNTQRYGWMGFISQAGLALSLASVLPTTFPGELGDSLYSMMLAGIALNEIFGPILLQWGLGLAGETEAQREAAAKPGEPDEDVSSAGEASEAPSADGSDPWGPPLELQARRLNLLVADLQTELQGVVRDLGEGPLQELQEDNEEHLRGLRREFLRSHRQATVRVQRGEPSTTVAAFLRAEVGELGDRWRDLVLSRAARAARADQWSPLELVDLLDRLANDLPEGEIVPLESVTLQPREGDGRLTRIRRAAWRARAWLAPRKREVSARTLGRYHLSGRAPARLEGLAALIISSELHLAQRTSALFDAFALAWETLAEQAEAQDCSTEALLQSLWSVRSELDEDFDLAFEELESLSKDGMHRATLALGGLMRDLKEDMVNLGTLDLPYWRRRYGRVFRERNQGLQTLGAGMQGARRTVRTRYGALALELELIGLEGRVRDVVEAHANQLARLVRGRGAIQLDRVDTSLTEAMESLEGVVGDAELGPEELSKALRSHLEPQQRLLSDTLRHTQGLAQQLAGETWIAPLTEALMTAAGNLTEWYTVPTEPPAYGEWSLPVEVSTTDIPFREVVLNYIDRSVTQDLLQLTRGLEQKVQGLVEGLHELERVVAFNLELACAELDALHQGEVIPDETRDLVREMVLGAVGRSLGRLREVRDLSATWGPESHDAVVRAVVGELEDLRGQVLDGRVNELRLFLLREAEVRARLVQRAGEWRGLLPTLVDTGREAVRGALGVERMEAARVYLGLPEGVVPERSATEAVAPPRPEIPLPIVYRRLFSDQALEAGDLLAGRHEEVAQLRDLLDPEGQALARPIALIGPDDISVGAVINAVIRSIEPLKVRRITVQDPQTEEEVASWFEAEPDQLNVLVGGLRWLFEARPGGLRPLQRLVRGMAEPGGPRWLLGSDSFVWSYATRLVPLDDAVAFAMHLRPLRADELAAAILARHSMSGYDIEYHGREDLSWQVQNLLLRRMDRESRGQRAWFQMLHDASGGHIHDALRLWMASVREVDDQAAVIRMGRVPRPPLTRLGGLPDEVQLALLVALRQGWITAELLGSQLDLDPVRARGRVATMESQGLLVRESGHLVVAGHLRASVERVLRGRGWAP